MVVVVHFMENDIKRKDEGKLSKGVNDSTRSQHHGSVSIYIPGSIANLFLRATSVNISFRERSSPKLLLRPEKKKKIISRCIAIEPDSWCTTPTFLLLQSSCVM